MFQVARDFEFTASHAVKGGCSTVPHDDLHRHLWRVRLVLAVEKPGDVPGADVWQPFAVDLAEQCQGRNLGDVLPAEPTAVGLAWHLFDVAVGHYWDKARALRVWESPLGYVEVTAV